MNVPDPIPIPFFRQHIQENFDQKRLTDDDRKYVVKVLGMVLCTHIQRPSMKDCLIVAKSLVAKYSFLKENTIHCTLFHLA